MNAKPASDETREAWAADARSAIVQDYGPHGATRAFADAKALIAQDGATATF